MMFSAKRNYAKRCVYVFSDVRHAIRQEVGEVIARHAADGLLRSGATIRQSISSFERHVASGTQLLQSEFASLIPSRGREWDRAMLAINEQIEGQFRSAHTVLERPFRIAAGTEGAPAEMGPSIKNSIADELRAAKERVLKNHAAFSDGWTAPIGKLWHERHPLLYALGAAVIGSILTTIVTFITK